jgi:hypothetical protein
MQHINRRGERPYAFRQLRKRPYKVLFVASFKRSFKKRVKGNSDLEAKFWQKLARFTIDPFDRCIS